MYEADGVEVGDECPVGVEKQGIAFLAEQERGS